MSDGWYPEARKQPSPNFFPGNLGVKATVIHVCEGGYQSSIDYMKGHMTSAHFIVSKQGEVSQMVNIRNGAWGNGLVWQPHGKSGFWRNPSNTSNVTPTWPDIIPGKNPNLYTISIEHEGFTGQPLTPKMKAATIKLLKWIASETGLVYVAGHTLIGHCHINPVDRLHCPGDAFDLAAIAQAANATPPPTPITRHFDETGHNLSNAFLLFWEALDAMQMPNGGGSVAVALLGYPIEEEKQATVGNWTGTVQYLQRARLEWHPDAPEGHKVQLGLLGAETIGG